VFETAMRANIAAATGGDSRLSRVRSGRGASIRVELDTRGSGSRTEAVVTPKGPIMLVERDTRAHVEPFEYAGVTGLGGRRRYATRGQRMASGDIASRRRASRAASLFIPGVGFRFRAKHPGTRGKHPVERAFRSQSDEAGRAGLLVFSQATQAHLKG
jgi:hypothetical protein